MKIVAISDTHNLYRNLDIPECDVLVSCGDHTLRGKAEECLDFVSWITNLDQAKHKIFIAGNHDIYFQHTKIPKNLNNKTYYLLDDDITIDGIKFYGTPWTPFFYDWAFNALEPKPGVGNLYRGGPGADAKPDALHPLMADKLSLVPKDTQVLICHGPPRVGKLDISRHGDMCGSYLLRDLIGQLPILQIGLFGHIHESRGTEEYCGVTCYNVSTLDRDYQTIRPPVVIEI